MPRLTGDRDRSTYLGASDIAVLAGVNPWRTPFELYLEKIGELDPQARASQAELDRYERGHRLEDVALDWHAEIAGISIERVRRDIVHPALPFVVVHPDARVKPWTKTRRLIEAKTSSRKWDEVPQYVEAQVQAQMAAAKADVADVVVLGFDGPPAVFEVARNDELIAGLEELAAAFWDRVVRRDPPPIDGSHGASRWLDRLFREGPEEQADTSQAEALARLLAIRAQVKELEAEDGALVNALKFSMAGGTRLYAPRVGRILWTAPTERRTVAWKDVVGEIRTALAAYPNPEPLLAELAAAEAAHTSVATDVRTFRPSPAKEEIVP